MTPRLGSDKFLLTFYFEIYISEGQLKGKHGIKLPKNEGYFHDKFTYLACNHTIIHLII